VAAARSKLISNRQLNSLTAIAQPLYQHAHGPRAVRHLGSKIKGAVHAGVLPTHKSGPWGTRLRFPRWAGVREESLTVAMARSIVKPSPLGTARIHGGGTYGCKEDQALRPTVQEVGMADQGSTEADKVTKPCVCQL